MENLSRSDYENLLIRIVGSPSRQGQITNVLLSALYRFVILLLNRRVTVVTTLGLRSMT